jgi:hypothetical protein
MYSTVCYTSLVYKYEYILQYCDMWAVSRKRIGKYVATERLTLGNQLVTEHGFHGYEN